VSDLSLTALITVRHSVAACQQEHHMNQQHRTAPHRASTEAPHSLGTAFKSVGAAFFGVQSSRNRRRDFTHGKPVYFLIVGLILSAAFSGVLYGLVRLTLHLGTSAGG
jgi:hypothetical protein